MISNDMKERFNSPTVNLYIPFPDYMYLIENLKDIVNENIADITGNNDFPIGLLGGKVHIYFLHYSSFEEACKKWHERAARIRYDNIYFILIERDGCTLEMLKKFDAMTLNHKIAIVHKPYDGLRCQAYIPGYEKDGEIGNIIEYTGISGKRIYDTVDWISFLNKK